MSQTRTHGDMSGVEGENHEERPPWQDPDVLHELYHEKDLTIAEVGDELGCSQSTASWWLRKLGVKDGYPDVDLPDDLPENPWKDEKLMRRLYHDEGLSGAEIAMVLDCSTGGVAEWIDKHDFKKRTVQEAMLNRDGSLKKANFRTHPTNGYEHWAPGDYHVSVHRLMMVAEHGFEAVRDKHVHHKNGIPWDNRYDNLELLTLSEHSSTHKKYPESVRRRIGKMYEETDKSSYQVADEVDEEVTPGTVREYREEFYG